MKENKYFKPLIGVACVAVLILVAVIGLLLDSRSPDPIWGIFRPMETIPGQTQLLQEQETQDTTSATTQTGLPTTEATATGSATETTMPSGEQPPEGETGTTPTIPSEGKPNTDPSDPALPYLLADYGLVIEKLAPYQGMYVEDGSNAQDVNAAMLMVYNDSSYPVEYTQLSVQCGKEVLTFDISAMPAGARVVVQEKNGKPLPEGQLESIDAIAVQRAELEMSEDKIRVTDNGNNTLTIENLTDELIPTVRVFYKYYMEQENIFVGGIAFTVRITRLGAGASVTIQPSHFTSQTSRVVMALTYDSEV